MKKINYLMFGMIFILLCSSLISASYIFKQNEDVNFKFRCFDTDNNYCSSSTDLVISVDYPNGTNILNNASLTYNPTYFNITLPTDSLGEYSAIISSFNGNATSEFTYKVTTNGREPAQGIVIVFFSILFLIILGALIYLIFYTAGHFIQLDFDLKDMTYNLSSYFVLFGIYILSKEYLANAFINDFLVWVIGICAITNVLFPIIAFALSLTLGKWREIESQIY